MFYLQFIYARRANDTGSCTRNETKEMVFLFGFNEKIYRERKNFDAISRYLELASLLRSYRLMYRLILIVITKSNYLANRNYGSLL